MLENYQDEAVFPDKDWKDHLGDKEQIAATIRDNLNKSRGLKPVVQHDFRRKYQWLKIASVIIIPLASFFIWKYRPDSDYKQITHADSRYKVIKPGTNNATLTLANGEIVVLDNAKKGKLSTEADFDIVKTSEGSLVYDASKAADHAAVGVNTITTPRGGQYLVVLSDGTKVWLNAGSSLTYTPVFSSNERVVKMTGEAYFEVAKDTKKPFKVMVNDMSVTVLGTHFNVMAYHEENAIKTTLLEGAVKLANNKQSVMLKPGEQALLPDNNQNFTVHEVSLDEEIAWKNGYFSFNNRSLEAIMTEISRWYDVDIVYENGVQKKNFGGTVSKHKDISHVLRVLELTGSVHFQIEGRRIIVKQ